MNRRSFLNFLASAPLAVPVAIVGAHVAPEKSVLKIEPREFFRGDAVRDLFDGIHERIARETAGHFHRLGRILEGPWKRK